MPGRNNNENEGHVRVTWIERIAVLGRDKLEVLQTVELDERWWVCGNGGNLRRVVVVRYKWLNAENSGSLATVQLNILEVWV